MRRWIWWIIAVLASVALLVAVRLGWLNWLASDSSVVRNVLEGLSWTAAIVALLLPVLNAKRQRRISTPEPESNVESDGAGVLAGRALHLVDDRLPRVEEVSLLALQVKPAIATYGKDGGDLPEYVPRDIDEDLDGAIARGGLVLLHGRAAAGKSRVAAEALRRLHPSPQMLVPCHGAALREIMESGQDFINTVVWLDDLERFLTPGGLDLALLQRFFPAGSTVAIMATIRDNELASLRRGDDTVNRAAAEVLASIPHNHWISVEKEFSSKEKTRAENMRKSDSRIARALQAHEGFGEYMAAGIAMLERWSIGDDSLFHVGQALISAAVDCRRAGYPHPVPAKTLATLHHIYLPAGWRDRADLPTVDEGLQWAQLRVLGASSCLQPRSDSTYLASDYLLDRAQEGASPLKDAQITDKTWHEVLDISTNDSDYISVASAAYDAYVFKVAEEGFRKAAKSGRFDKALALLCFALAEQKRFDKIIDLFQPAADSGDQVTLIGIVTTLAANDRMDDVTNLFKRAADTDNQAAIVAFGVALAQNNEFKQIVALAEYAAETNNTRALTPLAVFLAEQDRTEEIATLFYRAAEATPENATPIFYITLGVALVQHHKFDAISTISKHVSDIKNYKALLALSSALMQADQHEQILDTFLYIASGKNDSSAYEALLSLGKLLIQKGKFDQIVTLIQVSNDSTIHAVILLALTQLATIEDLYKLLQKVAEPTLAGSETTNVVRVMVIIANSLAQKGAFDQLATAFQWAADTKNISALSTLGILLAQYDKFDQIARLFQHAANANNAVALSILGATLAQRNKFEQISTLSKLAADTNNNSVLAAFSLGFTQKDKFKEVAQLFKQAGKDENPGAFTVFNKLLNQHVSDKHATEKLTGK